jgi:hypothetical protein
MFFVFFQNDVRILITYQLIIDLSFSFKIVVNNLIIWLLLNFQNLMTYPNDSIIILR